MHVLIVLSHPVRQSFTAALKDRFERGLVAAGHTAELADLHAEAFDPRMTVADFAQFDGDGATLPAAIVCEQERLARADVLSLVFPVYWWSFPAMLKGWIDRVMTQGFAYDFTLERSRGLLKTRKAILLGSGGSSHATYRRYGYHGAMQRQIDAGILGYCGIADVETHIFPAVGAGDAVHAAHLARAEEIGRTLRLAEPDTVFPVA
jgi:NAD(P)H dehydrogenase (quinone)